MKKNLFLLTAIAFAFVTTTSVAQNVPSYVPTNGLIAWWPFTGNAIDSSGHGYNGIVSGASAANDRFGNTNRAYNFNGSNQNILVNNFPVNNGALSISFWFNPASINSVVRVITHDWSNNGSFTTHIYPSPSNYFGVATNNSSNQGSGVVTPNIIKQNTWYFVTATFSGVMDKLFLNGILIDSSATLNLKSSINPLYIGGDNTFPFHGLIDDVGIWNRALTTSEIRQIYLASCTTPATPTITALGNTTFCRGEEVMLLNSSAYSLFQWKKGNSNISGAVNSNYAAKNTGSYKCTITNACGTVTSNVINVVRNPLASVSISAGGPLSFCLGGSVTLTATNPGAGYTYQWIRNNVSIAGATGLSYTAYNTGNYKIQITNTVNGCFRTSGTKTVTINCKNGVAQTSQDITNNINVYPNPVSNSFTFELNEDVKGIATISLQNTLGQIVFENKSEVENGQPIENIFINDKLKAGLYILRIEVGDKRYVSKVVVN